MITVSSCYVVLPPPAPPAGAAGFDEGVTAVKVKDEL